MRNKQEQKKQYVKRNMVFAMLGFVFVCIIAGGLLSAKLLEVNPRSSTQQATVSVSPTQTTFSYRGESGKDALTILREKATIQQDASGLVIGINGKKAQSTNREYWAFYVNDTLSSVGPSQYNTKDSDKIEWRIERY